MDSDIQERFTEASKNCLEAFISWDDKKKDKQAQEVLHAAIHELRKVSSRLEIELAMSERDQLSSKPLPIPAHRSNMKGDPGSILEGNNDMGHKGKGGGRSAVIQNKTKRRRSSPHKRGGGNGGD
ncbi:MAG: hypothetical protein KAJ29_00915 [Alphaproteobacteria bacterium]|nr:hypothetical protein [Alphaproteobacteria bacterium]